MTRLMYKALFVACGFVLLPIGAMAKTLAEPVNAAGLSVTPQVLVRWQRGAEHGYGPDQYRLGLAYATGDGVPQNLGKAAYWWRKSADLLDPKAELMMGNAYAHGWGVPQNIDKAIRWWKTAARSEAPDVARRAQFLLDSAA